MRRGRDGLRQRARDLAEPRVVGDDRQRAAGGGLGGDHPERLGERARDRHRLGRGQQVGELGVVEPPGPRDAVAQALGGVAVASRRRARRGTRASCGSSRPSSARVCAAASRSPAASCSASRSSPGRNAPKPTIISRARGSRASTSGNAASSSSTPLDAISLPTNTTSRSPGSTLSRAATASPTSRREARSRRRRAAGAAAPPRRRRASARAAPRRSALRALARREAGHIDARRPEAGPAGQRRVVHLRPQALGRVARADEHAARAREALDGERLEARIRLDGVLQRAAVDLDRVRARRPRAPRARIAGPITRWLASATSTPARATTSRTASTFAAT